MYIIHSFAIDYDIKLQINIGSIIFTKIIGKNY
jgi:hypothetical protein